jgi:hypothetical protein
VASQTRSVAHSLMVQAHISDGQTDFLHKTIQREGFLHFSQTTANRWGWGEHGKTQTHLNVTVQKQILCPLIAQRLGHSQLATGKEVNCPEQRALSAMIFVSLGVNVGVDNSHDNCHLIVKGTPAPLLLCGNWT